MNWRDAIPKSEIPRIIREVSDATGVPVRDILGPSRTQHIVHARFLAIWRAAKETNLSQPQIGRAFNRDHTSIGNAIRRMDAKMKQMQRAAE